MNFWIFSVTNEGPHTAKEKFDIRMGEKFWGLSEASNAKRLRKDDEVVFYIGSPEKKFSGTARLASDYHELTAAERARLTGPLDAKHGVWLEAVKKFEPPKLHSDFKLELTKFKTATQGAIHSITEDDYKLIIGGAPSA
jgi:hypothetical protein